MTVISVSLTNDLLDRLDTFVEDVVSEITISVKASSRAISIPYTVAPGTGSKLTEAVPDEFASASVIVTIPSKARKMTASLASLFCLTSTR